MSCTDLGRKPQAVLEARTIARSAALLLCLLGTLGLGPASCERDVCRELSRAQARVKQLEARNERLAGKLHKKVHAFQGVGRGHRLHGELEPGSEDLARRTEVHARQLELARQRVFEISAGLGPEQGCSGPSLFFVAPDETAPLLEQLPPTFDAMPRPLASARDHRGHEGDFVADEIVVPTSVAAAVAARWNGVVLEEFAVAAPGATAFSLIRVDTSVVETSELASQVDALSAAESSAVQVSSEAGLRLLALVASEATAGNEIAINWVGRGADFDDGLLAESFVGPISGIDWSTGPTIWSRNPYDWVHFSEAATQGMGVTEAWTAMDAAGALRERVGLAILDMGFRPDVNGDFPDGFRAFSIVADSDPLLSENRYGCGGGNPCRWHGTGVLNAAAGAVDNEIAAAGTGGPVADAIAVYLLYDLFSTVIALDQARIAGARVANMSFGGWVPAGLEWSMLPFDPIFRTLHAEGMVLVAAAGNDSGNVDAAACIFDLCWEEGFNYPCELGEVLCIGALAHDSLGRADYSNFGSPDRGFDNGTVDLFAPGLIPTGPDPDAPGSSVQEKRGTSLASPYAAGVAALLFASDPSISAGDVASILVDTGRRNPDDDTVNRVISPRVGVQETLSRVCPCASIASPGRAEILPEGLFVFEGRSYAPATTVASADWTIREGDPSGPIVSMASGLIAPILVRGDGFYFADLTVAYGNGSVASDTVPFRIENGLPTANITSPPQGSTFTRTEQVVLRVDASDPGYPEGVPNSNIDWFVDGVPFESGDDRLVDFSGVPLGLTNLEVVVDDGFAMASDSVVINLIEGGPNGPPSARIVEPGDGERFDAMPVSGGFAHFVRFRVSANDPEGDPLTIIWEASQGGGPFVEIGRGHEIIERFVVPCFGDNFTIRVRVSDGINAPRQDAIQIFTNSQPLC
ncbi:MAG: S8 family serine peptidase [Deltaproteobacteria bacterium]|nr:S8 family serine peptidase [Deltaproteobacteria bacterium]